MPFFFRQIFVLHLLIRENLLRLLCFHRFHLLLGYNMRLLQSIIIMPSTSLPSLSIIFTLTIKTEEKQEAKIQVILVWGKWKKEEGTCEVIVLPQVPSD